MPDSDPLPLCRLPFTGILHTWGLALYLASGGYADSVLSSGLPFGSPEDALVGGNLAIKEIEAVGITYS
ncbi:hypothetical protein ACFV1F_03990 [Streptomyces sp. NPDC059590]|uniref:hypothetical protein n=1 Tax=Streptomyces sp. NPDC059590 TaxID=3346877 RepID=UPI0036B0A8C6